MQNRVSFHRSTNRSIRKGSATANPASTHQTKQNVIISMTFHTPNNAVITWQPWSWRTFKRIYAQEQCGQKSSGQEKYNCDRCFIIMTALFIHHSIVGSQLRSAEQTINNTLRRVYYKWTPFFFRWTRPKSTAIKIIRSCSCNATSNCVQLDNRIWLDWIKLISYTVMYSGMESPRQYVAVYNCTLTLHVDLLCTRIHFIYVLRELLFLYDLWGKRTWGPSDICAMLQWHVLCINPFGMTI
jgi:hypothetical protein